MATVSNTFEGGSNGTTITTGNSAGASGTAFDAVGIVAGGGAVYTNTNQYRGALGATLSTGGTAGQTYVEYTTALNCSSSGSLYGRTYRKLPALPPDANGHRIILIADSASAFQAEWRINNAGRLEQRSGAGVVTNTSTNAITTGAYFRVEFAILAFSATVGQLECKLFLSADSSTPTETLTSTAALDTLRAGGLCKARAGINRNLASFVDHVDDVTWSTTAYPGPSALPPQVVVISTALSTELALPLGRTKTRALALADETGTAPTFARAKARAIGLAAGTDTALSLSRHKDRSITAASETDVALAITASGSVITRPSTGTTSRPATGTITRPDTGLVTRP